MRYLFVGLLLIVVAAVAMLVVGSKEASPEAGEVAGEAEPKRVSTLSEPADEPAAAPAASDSATGSEAEREDVPVAVPMRELRVEVLDGDGRPLPGAKITVEQVLTPWPQRARSTVPGGVDFADDAGRATLSIPGDPRELMVRVVHPDHARFEVPLAEGESRVTARLEPGFVVDGIVVDARGRPVADAEVVMDPTGWDVRRGRAVRTDGFGRFRIENVAAGRSGVLRLTARHELSAPATLNNVPVATASGLQIKFPELPGESLVGRVVTVDGAPIEDASIQLFPSVEWNAQLGVPHEARTDATGRFVIPGLGRGNALMVIRRAGHSILQRIVPVGRTAGEREFELVEGVRVVGRLRGEGVAGVTLELTTDMGERVRTEVDGDGRFEFGQRVSVGTADLSVVGGTLAFATSQGRQASILVEDRDRTELDLECIAPAVVRGRVIDPAGRPLAGVVVSAPRYRLQPRNPERWSIATDSAGRFMLAGLQVGTRMLWFEHPELVVQPLSVEIPAPGAEVDVPDVRLQAPGSISGRVVRGGRPLAGASVSAAASELDSNSAVTDAAGHYLLRGLPSGEYRVHARFATLPIQVVADTIQVEAGRDTADVDFEFAAGRTVSGQVVAEGGEPLRDAEIFVARQALAAPVTTDADGRFEMMLPPGEANLEVFAPGDRQVHVTRRIGAEESDIEVRLPYVARTTLRGRILTKAQGGSLVGALIRVHPIDVDDQQPADARRQRHVAGRWVDLRGGRFEWAGLPVGHSRVEIDAPGFAPVVREVTAAPGETVDLGLLRIEPGARFRGRVVDTSGKPVAGAYVHVGEGADLLYEGVRRSTSAADGTFELQGLSVDARRIVVAAPEFAVRVFDVDFPKDLLADEPRVIEVVPISTIRVQLTRDAAPVDDAVLVAISYEGELKAMRLSVDGVVEFGVNVAGTYEVAQFGEWEHSASIEVRDGEAKAHEVQLELR